MDYTQEVMIKILSSAIHKKKFDLSECDDIDKIDFNKMLMFIGYESGLLISILRFLIRLIFALGEWLLLRREVLL